MRVLLGFPCRNEGIPFGCICFRMACSLEEEVCDCLPSCFFRGGGGGSISPSIYIYIYIIPY